MTARSEALAVLCREGERVCNCGQAFETWHTPAESRTTRCINGRVQPVGAWLCKHGCSAACIAATNRLAAALVERQHATSHDG